VTRIGRAHALALAVPTALMAGALGSQYWGGLYPCEMCHWQRWPHYAAIILALMAFAVRPMRGTLIALAGLAILTSGAIGVWHAGVEYHWWPGITTCASTSAGSTLNDLMRAPLIRCDRAQWMLLGVSLAGYNAIISIAGGLGVLALIGGKR
jgi:disulfide bond formation protein DsbB